MGYQLFENFMAVRVPSIPPLVEWLVLVPFIVGCLRGIVSDLLLGVSLREYCPEPMVVSPFALENELLPTLHPTVLADLYTVRSEL